ncbi:MAG: hypothetical protein PHO44_00960 [Sphaerochaetaceae bacterium]|nr:hypothetical protein [Sphaerochaetaceae bacterium]MDD3162607.1 hypothetical protein [Sphaerochaetaceae bacterium]MDD4006526.1 hypothetical protein [Sphaerochaetaceae bacterium]MDD4395937.1 hypothetical protein [Sphaerochaetaceae bacterium]
MKRILCTLALLVACLSLFAGGQVLTFLWDWDDFDVTRFRYQLDAQTEGLWTECEYYETSAAFDSIDLSVPHTLYVQQSYDGINWSESSSLVSEVSVSAQEIVAEQAVEESPAQEAVVESTPVEEAETPVIAEYVPKYDIGLRLLLKSDLTSDTGKTFEAGAVFGMPNLWKFGTIFNLGLRFNAIADFYPRSPARLDSINVSALSVWSMMLSDKLYLGIPVGIEMAGNLETGSFKFGIGGSAGAYIGFMMGKHFMAEIEGLFHVLTTEQTFSAGLSFSYKF